MVSAYRADALRDPTSELRELFAAHAADDNFAAQVTRHFTSVFSSKDAFTEIPSLDVRNPPETHSIRSLVRFRAMVQDTSPSSEMYLRKTKSGSLGGWGVHEDSEEGLGPVDYSELRECNVLWAVSVPGETDWCLEELSGPERSVQKHTPARSHKHPDPDNSHIGVQVKVYDLNAAEGLKSTEIVTFVGILDKEPLDIEADAPADVPTLHVLFVQAHDQGLLRRDYPTTNVAPIRDELVEWLATEALAGDREAAEWVLLASIARVQSRNPPLLPPSVTLSHFPSPPIPSTSPDVSGSASTLTLSHVLSQLLPLTRTLPLSLPLLNKVPFAPESKEEDLHSGALQLPQGSVLLVTEGGVQEGKLVERGLKNISALQEVISAQTLGYIFPFSRFSFPTDISCIVLSEGKKSAFFKTDISIPFKPEASTPADISNMYKPADRITMPSPEKLAAFRDLVVGAQQGSVQVSEAASEFIQQDFVRARQQDSSVTSDDLIRQMTVAKLYALSFHETELSIDMWKRATAFDQRRKERLAAL